MPALPAVAAGRRQPCVLSQACTAINAPAVLGAAPAGGPTPGTLSEAATVRYPLPA
jgi:hypothetical protein